MSDTAPAPSRIASAAPILAGAISALMFHSGFVTIFFLLPVQMAFGRGGVKRGWMALVLAGILICSGTALQAFAGGPVGEGGALRTAAALIFLVVIGLMNGSRMDGVAISYRILAGAALSALALGMAVAFFGRPLGVEATVASVQRQVAEMFTGAGPESGYDASVFKIQFGDAATQAEMVRASLIASLLPTSLVVVGGSWWLGGRLSGPGSPGMARTPPLAELRLPYVLIWALIASWVAVLVSGWFELPAIVQAIALNLALALVLAYAAQGLGVASFLLVKWNTPRFLRFALGGLVLVTIVPIVLLPVLGVTEVWIPYRKTKGVGA